MNFKKKIVLLTMLCFFISVGQGGAAICFRNYHHYPNDLATATGIVQTIGRNSIEIFDEEQKKRVSFIDVGQVEQYHKGDYVRIFYHPQNGIVAMIKKMTILAYKENGQNLGYIYSRH